MVKPLEESISNIFSYDRKHISRDRSILRGSSVVEFCHRFSARVVPLQITKGLTAKRDVIRQ